MCQSVNLITQYIVTLLLVNVHIFISECDDGENLSYQAYCKEGDHCVLSPIGMSQHPETQTCTSCPSGATTVGEG